MQNIEKVCEFTIFLTKSQISKEFYFFFEKIGRIYKVNKNWKTNRRIWRKFINFQQKSSNLKKNHLFCKNEIDIEKKFITEKNNYQSEKIYGAFKIHKNLTQKKLRGFQDLERQKI